MTSKSDRSFPCFLWLSEPFSEQDHGFDERSGQDYVFFPATEFQQGHDRCVERESEHRALPKAPERVTADA